MRVLTDSFSLGLQFVSADQQLLEQGISSVISESCSSCCDHAVCWADQCFVPMATC